MNSENFTDLGFAKLDINRESRTGINETVFCTGKTKKQILDIFQTFKKQNKSVLGTKCSIEQFEFVHHEIPQVQYNPVSGIICLKEKAPQRLDGRIAVCTAGTSDLPIAQEAVDTAVFLGATVEKYFDIGIAGIHRLLSKLELIRKADIIIAVAGMDGALPGVIAGLVDQPVIAVPTSVGYGTSFQGVSALLTMLNSCAEGVCVVNIDNGFGAAVTACKMIKQMKRKDL